MNVLILTHSLSGGGSEKVAANVSLAISRVARVSILCIANQHVTYKYSGEIVSIARRPMRGLSGKAVSWLIYLFEITRFCHVNKIDVVLAFDLWPNIIAHIIPGRFIRIGSIHNDVRRHLSGKETVHALFLRYYCGLVTDGIVAVSNGVRTGTAEFAPQIVSKISVIHNAATDSQGEPLVRTNAPLRRSGPVKLLCCGRLTHQKGQDILLRALGACSRTRGVLQLILLGSGPERESLQALCRFLNIEEWVSFIDYTERPFKIFEQCDLLVVPSRFEGFGNVIVEAMALKLGIIATDCWVGPRELLGGGQAIGTASGIEYLPHGILVPDPLVNERRTVDALTTVLEQIIDGRIDPTLLQCRAASRASSFHPERIGTCWRHFLGDHFGNRTTV